MPINFFDDDCKTSSALKEFGLCDDPPPATNSAYIDENDVTKWIGIVENNNDIAIDFYAIDHCVTILRPDFNRENRCDGMLHYENNLIFVELKDKGHGGWLGRGRNQLTKTIQAFATENNIHDYTNIAAYVANKLKPKSHFAQNIEIQKFKDETGLRLHVKQKIEIS